MKSNWSFMMGSHQLEHGESSQINQQKQKTNHWIQVINQDVHQNMIKDTANQIHSMKNIISHLFMEVWYLFLWSSFARIAPALPLSPFFLFSSICAFCIRLVVWTRGKFEPEDEAIYFLFIFLFTANSPLNFIDYSIFGVRFWREIYTTFTTCCFLRNLNCWEATWMTGVKLY